MFGEIIRTKGLLVSFKADTFTDLIKKGMSDAFESIMKNEIDRIESEAIEKIKKSCNDHRVNAKKYAYDLSVSLLRKANIDSYTVIIEENGNSK